MFYFWWLQFAGVAPVQDVCPSTVVPVGIVWTWSVLEETTNSDKLVWTGLVSGNWPWWRKPAMRKQSLQKRNLNRQLWRNRYLYHYLMIIFQIIVNMKPFKFKLRYLMFKNFRFWFIDYVKAIDDKCLLRRISNRDLL